MRARSWRASGPRRRETAAEFGLRVDVQPETAAVGPLVDALAAHAARLRAEGAPPPPRKKSRRRRHPAATRVHDTHSPSAPVALDFGDAPFGRRNLAGAKASGSAGMFVADGIDAPRPIGLMPGVVPVHLGSCQAAAQSRLSRPGVGGLMLFGGAQVRGQGCGRLVGPDSGGIPNVALRDLVKDVGADTVLMADTCLDEFTDHGHRGPLDCRDGWITTRPTRNT